MSIALVTTSYPATTGDPAGHFVATEARELAAGGADVVVIAPGTAREGATGVRRVAVPGSSAFGWPGALARLRARPWRAVDGARFVLGARRALEREGPFERVIAHWLVPSGWPIALAARAELEVVAHGSDVRLLDRLPRPLARRILAMLCDRGARLRCVSEELLGRLAAIEPAVRARAFVRACPIDVRPAPGRAEARRRLGLSERERLAVVVGRLVPEKRIDAAIGAAASRAARVVVVGDGPLAGALSQRHPHVRFTGRLARPEALAWIAAADWLVSASLEEGAPTVVREARALGVRVLCAPAGDLARWAAEDPGIELLGGAGNRPAHSLSSS